VSQYDGKVSRIIDCVDAVEISYTLPFSADRTRVSSSSVRVLTLNRDARHDKLDDDDYDSF
jgi:hypothetical protein